MLTIQHTDQFRIESPTIVTIGTFDGVHLGHQKILGRLQALKQSTGLKTVVLTFDPHPRKVLFPEQKDLKLITLVDEKLELLEKYGVDVTVVYPFSREFSQLDSELYVKEILMRQLNVQYLVIGYDHKFGKNRQGDINTLRGFAPGCGFSIEEISAQDIDSMTISSSRIRKALEEGRLDLAGEYLGYAFFLNGKVVKGKQLGRTIGFPTANIQPAGEEKIIPQLGIYFVSLVVEGKNHYGMMSIGYNPTTDTDHRIKLEVNIFDFSADIYDRTIKLIFLKRLRDEKKFATLNDLKAQLHRDREMCLQLIKDLS